MPIRTTNWNNINKVRKTKAQPLTTLQKKKLIVQKILRRYDLWHNGIIVKALRKIHDDFTTHIVITEAYTLSNLMNAVALDNKKRIKEFIDQRINLRGQAEKNRKKKEEEYDARIKSTNTYASTNYR